METNNDYYYLVSSGDEKNSEKEITHNTAKRAKTDTMSNTATKIETTITEQLEPIHVSKPTTSPQLPVPKVRVPPVIIESDSYWKTS